MGPLTQALVTACEQFREREKAGNLVIRLHPNDYGRLIGERNAEPIFPGSKVMQYGGVPYTGLRKAEGVIYRPPEGCEVEVYELVPAESIDQVRERARRKGSR